jgi:hypothetical protein
MIYLYLWGMAYAGVLIDQKALIDDNPRAHFSRFVNVRPAYIPDGASL